METYESSNRPQKEFSVRGVSCDAADFKNAIDNKKTEAHRTVFFENGSVE